MRPPPHPGTSAPLHILVTGCAGFIGWKVTEFLLADGHTVVGIDNLNDAYDPRLKHWRLDQIKDHPNFTFHRLEITDREGLRALFNPQSAIRNSTPSSTWPPRPASPARWPARGGFVR